MTDVEPERLSSVYDEAHFPPRGHTSSRAQVDGLALSWPARGVRRERAPVVATDCPRVPYPWWARPAEAVLLGDRALVAPVLDASLIALASWVEGMGARSVMLAVALVAMAGASGLYRSRSTVEAQGMVWCARPLVAVALGGVGAAWVIGANGDGLAGSVLVAATASLGLLAVRGLAWVVVSGCRRRGMGLRPTLVVASAEEANLLRGKLATFSEAGLGFGRAWDPTPLDGLAALPGAHAGVTSLAGVDHVLVGADVGRPDLVHQLVEGCQQGGVPVSLAIGISPVALPWDCSRIGDLAVANVAVRRRRYLSPLVKRVVDVLLASALLLVLAAPMALIALLVWLEDRGPALYRQTRVGKNGASFVILKFRSMVQGADRLVVGPASRRPGSGLLHKIDGDPRVTRIGWVIRRLSIDELPQLLNVVRGDMSLVGPRPLPVRPSQFDPRAMGRHAVRPGMTGPWQVEGANALTYEDMIRMDLAYVANWSLGVDLRILVRTIPAILVRRSAF